MVRDKIKVGNIVKYKNKRYIVICHYFDCGGNSMVIGIVRYFEDLCSKIKIVKYLYDKEIEYLEIL